MVVAQQSLVCGLMLAARIAHCASDTLCGCTNDQMLSLPGATPTARRSAGSIAAHDADRGLRSEWGTSWRSASWVGACRAACRHVIRFASCHCKPGRDPRRDNNPRCEGCLTRRTGRLSTHSGQPRCHSGGAMESAPPAADVRDAGPRNRRFEMSKDPSDRFGKTFRRYAGAQENAATSRASGETRALRAPPLTPRSISRHQTVRVRSGAHYSLN